MHLDMPTHTSRQVSLYSGVWRGKLPSPARRTGAKKWLKATGTWCPRSRGKRAEPGGPRRARALSSPGFPCDSRKALRPPYCADSATATGSPPPSDQSPGSPRATGRSKPSSRLTGEREGLLRKATEAQIAARPRGSVLLRQLQPIRHAGASARWRRSSLHGAGVTTAGGERKRGDRLKRLGAPRAGDSLRTYQASVPTGL